MIDATIAGAVIVGAALIGAKSGRLGGLAVSGGETLSGGGGRPWEAIPSDTVRGIIERIPPRFDIPRAFAFADAAHESRFKPYVGLNTLAGGVPQDAIPERSIGLFGINVNPNTPVGQNRIAQIKRLRGVNSDGGVLSALRDPVFNAEYWSQHIVSGLIAKANGEGLTGRDKWLQIRCWLYGNGVSLNGTSRWARITRTDFSRTLARWENEYGRV